MDWSVVSVALLAGSRMETEDVNRCVCHVELYNASVDVL